MIQRLVWLLILCSCVLPAQENKQESKAPSPAELAAVSARGRMLAEYDVAAWHATDVVEALKPDRAAAPMYIARKVNEKWEVVFGRLNDERDRFLIMYRATQGANPDDFTAKKSNPPAEDRGFYLDAARALETATADFGRLQRPYNTYVVPTGNGQLYVYFMPAQTSDGIYPLGGDVRYTITLDGGTIVNKRQMHTTVVENKAESPDGQKLVAGTHTHAKNNEIEDSDVFHVLVRTPSIPEYVGTPDKHLYEIETDGTIKRVQ
jgi:hypothetical protein